MSVNSSSSSSKYFPHCSNTRTGFFISIAFMISKTLLLLPLSIFVLYLGLERRRQQRSFATTSHCDIFTYHMAALELIFALGSTLYICGTVTGLSEVTSGGFYVCSFVFHGEVSFHILTCVERYLAVVHPVTYMGLKQSGGVKIRNISIVCVWLLCFGWSGVQCVIDHPTIPVICSLALSLLIVTFCSLRVLCVLIRPGLGDVCGDRERVDQSKQRAANTVRAIMGMLWLAFAGLLVCLTVDLSQLLSYSDGCVVLRSGQWFILPSNLVLPLLFLHRAGKLHCYH